MTLPSFGSYVRDRATAIPQADRVLPLLAQAGTEGMTRRQLGSAVRLPRDALDALLHGLTAVGLVAFADGADGPVYYARAGSW